MMMTVTLSETMNRLSVDKFKNKNELLYNYQPKGFSHQDYYIAPPVKPKGRRATFQAAMKLTIIIGQCFGLNPVLGVTEIDTSKLRFKFGSGRCLYSILTILGQSGLVFLCILKLIKNTDGSLSSNTSIVFYGTNCLTTMLFLKIAMKWPRLCQQISKTEAADPNKDDSLIKKCNISCILILCLAIVEHTLSDITGLAFAIDCQPEKNLYEAFFLTTFPWIWIFIPYNHLYGFISQFINIQCTFNWNFADVFVICISWYLSSRFEQINQRIIAVRGKVVKPNFYVPSSFWRAIREDYSRVANLVRKVDDVVSSVIFVSFANNLFFICLQLLHTLDEGIKFTPACNRDPDERPMRGYEQAVYLIYSFSFLLMRSLAVSLIAARVHTASRAPTQELYDVPSSAYSVEVQRFLSQLHGDTVALSGLQFFNVKRGLVLTIAGTIVTYELVLMQFAGVTPTVSPVDSPAAPLIMEPSDVPTPL